MKLIGIFGGIGLMVSGLVVAINGMYQIHPGLGAIGIGWGILMFGAIVTKTVMHDW